ncbi:Alpha/Beta hydrolase protein [Cadophora sp. MPI-SDFR-AT-0126]|nr:Alpha/Beta hydrolase protein [Leotiomycetes sp. MPI-SDFR-AT-0126]
MDSIQHHCPSLSADLVAAKDTEADLALFRGIPYATVSKRWTQSQIQDSITSPFDATKFGPRCPQPPHVSLITATAKVPDLEEDEFACLNLNISVPLDALPKPMIGNSKSLLPVMVWIHGGAFKNGSASDPRFYPSALSTLASSHNHPVIIVQVSYRLGVFGFAASSDLLSEQTSTSPSPSEDFANFGLNDQRTAFQWIQSHIQDFGGDPNNVTAFGVSAGSASLHMHILSGQPLFDRAVLMSGCAPTMGPFPLPLLDKSWSKLCQKSGADTLETSQQRLEKLRLLTPEEAIANNGLSTTLAPLADGSYLPASWKLGDAHPPARCKEMIIGNTLVEAIIFDILAKLLPQPVFHSKLLAAFPNPEDSTRFIELFGFDFSEGKQMDPEAYRDALRRFLSAVIFHYPSLIVAESFSSIPSQTKSYLYRFSTPSPFPGPSYGLSAHGQCAIFLFNNDSGSWPSECRVISKEMARTWTAFAHGEKPWEEFVSGDEGKVMSFGNGVFGARGLDEGEDEGWGREDGTTGWLRAHFNEALMFVLGLIG